MIVNWNFNKTPLISQHPFFHYQPPPQPPKPKKVRKRTKLVVPGPLLGPINEADYHQTPFYHHGNGFFTKFDNWKNSIFLAKLKKRPESVTGPFICPYCQRSFKREKYLRFHLNAHAGYRPYMCNICGKQARDMYGMKKHLEGKHEITPGYNCTICHLFCKTKSILLKHKKTYHWRKIKFGLDPSVFYWEYLLYIQTDF